ncbi:PIN domain-like protein, partial [Blyttiomyces helicus]
MGIQGLIPYLKSIHREVHIRNYAGCTLAVDSYVWLHKGAFSCAYELCQGLDTDKYVNFCMRKVKLLQDNGIRPLMVFDGGPLPMKAGTERERRRRRRENRRKGLELLRKGEKAKATDYFQKSVDVTPRMAHKLIQALKQANVDFVVAPYEADAQLAYLERSGAVAGVITEDSDLLVFGCKKVGY